MDNLRTYAKDTYIISRCPWGTFVKAMALCPDGLHRIVKLAATADSFFSVPASLSYRGKTVSGFITWKSDSGLSTDPAQWVAFVPTGKHAGIFGDR